jgi:hypothetical protein
VISKVAATTGSGYYFSCSTGGCLTSGSAAAIGSAYVMKSGLIGFFFSFILGKACVGSGIAWCSGS